MTISIPKTKVLIIKKRNNQSKIIIDNNKIEEVNIFHYLVLTINTKGTSNDVVTTNIAEAKNRSY